LKAKLSLVTLGVEDIARSRRFYEEGLGWTASAQSNENVVFFQANGVVIGLYGRSALAEDAMVEVDGAAGAYGGAALARNELDRESVNAVIDEARAAGATITKEAQETFWGGYGGYFKDPDGHLWEVAHNPFFPLDEDGSITLPD
jgi:hypothetical protein